MEVDVATGLSDAELAAIAQDVVDNKIKGTTVNAIAVNVFADREANYGLPVAIFEWAPNGEWADADKVRTGEYETHRLHRNS